MALNRTKNAEKAKSLDVLVPQESEESEIEASPDNDSGGHTDPPSSSNVHVLTNPTASLDNVSRLSSIVAKKTAAEPEQEVNAASTMYRELGDAEDASHTSTQANVPSLCTNTWEEWQLVPHVTFVGQGYDIRWQLTSLPTQQQASVTRSNKTQRWGKKRPLNQLSELDVAERAVLERRIMEENENPDVHSIVLLDISQKKATIPEEILSNIRCRCTTVIVQKGHLGTEGLKGKKREKGEADKAFRERVRRDFSTAGSDEANIAKVLDHVGKGREHYQRKPMDLARPTYIKVHRKHLSPDTLDVYEIPWEWCDIDPDCIVIERWMPERDQEILFEHTRKLHEQRLLRTRTTEFKKGRDSLLLVGKRGSAGREHNPTPDKSHFINPSSLSDSESDKPPHRRSSRSRNISRRPGDERSDSIPQRENEESMRGDEQSFPQEKTEIIIEGLLKEYTTLDAEVFREE